MAVGAATGAAVCGHWRAPREGEMRREIVEFRGCEVPTGRESEARQWVVFNLRTVRPWIELERAGKIWVAAT